MRQVFKDYMNAEVSDWFHQGLISAGTRELLAQRYERSQSALGTIIKWLGLFAMFFLGTGILSFVAIAAASKIGAVIELGLGVIVFGYWGIKKVKKIPVPDTFIGSALITTALMGFCGELVLINLLLTGHEASTEFLMGCFYCTSALSLLTAYVYRLRWPLLLSLLIFFHTIGSGNAYSGSGSYVFWIVNEKMMAIVSCLVLVIGILHERFFETEERLEYEGFGRFYIVFALLYGNCALWFQTLSFFSPHSNEVLLFTASCIAQLIAGARFKDGRFLGFGIVFLSIDLYTRFFENFWNSMSQGLFFLIAGVIALGIGFIVEKLSLVLKPSQFESQERA